MLKEDVKKFKETALNVLILLGLMTVLDGVWKQLEIWFDGGASISYADTIIALAIIIPLWIKVKSWIEIK